MYSNKHNAVIKIYLYIGSRQCTKGPIAEKRSMVGITTLNNSIGTPMNIIQSLICTFEGLLELLSFV